MTLHPAQPRAHAPSAAQLDVFLAAAVDAAREAGAVILDGARNRASLQIERKSANDFVSKVDKGAEQAILASLSSRFPAHAFIAEETGNSGSSEHVWLIDPLDGTTNFLHGIPHYCISIGLRIGEQVMAAVILDPLNDRLFTATRGGGSRLNGEPIRVAPRESLDEAVIGTGIPFSDLSFMDAYMASLRTIASRTAGIRRAGAAALDLAYVAAGWLDGFWEKNLHPWDVAAGSLLIQEAGGVITDFSGGGAFIMSGQAVAGAPGVHRALLDVLRDYPALAAPRVGRTG